MKFNLEAEQERLRTLQEQYVAARKTADDLWEQIRPLKQRIADHRLEQLFQDGITFGKILALDWTEVEGVWHSRLMQWLRGRCGIWASGYRPDTNQIAIKIQLHSKTPWREQCDILEVLPHLKPLANGKLHVGVFERTCSEYGSYYFEIPPESPQAISLLRKSYGHVAVIKEFSSWEEALQYIHAYHPFD